MNNDTGRIIQIGGSNVEPAIPNRTLGGWRTGDEVWASVQVIGMPSAVFGTTTWVEMGSPPHVWWMLSVLVPMGWVDPTLPEHVEQVFNSRYIVAIEASSMEDTFANLFQAIVPGQGKTSIETLRQRGSSIAARYREKYGTGNSPLHDKRPTTHDVEPVDTE